MGWGQDNILITMRDKKKVQTRSSLRKSHFPHNHPGTLKHFLYFSHLPKTNEMFTCCSRWCSTSWSFSEFLSYTLNSSQPSQQGSNRWLSKTLQISANVAQWLPWKKVQCLGINGNVSQSVVKNLFAQMSVVVSSEKVEHTSVWWCCHWGSQLLLVTSQRDQFTIPG